MFGVTTWPPARCARLGKPFLRMIDQFRGPWDVLCRAKRSFSFFLSFFFSFFFFPKLRACERFSIVIVRVAHAVFIRFNDVAELFKASSTN